MLSARLVADARWEGGGAVEKGLLPLGIPGSCLELVHMGARACARGGRLGLGEEEAGRETGAGSCLPRRLASVAQLRAAGFGEAVLSVEAAPASPGVSPAPQQLVVGSWLRPSL